MTTQSTESSISSAGLPSIYRPLNSQEPQAFRPSLGNRAVEAVRINELRPEGLGFTYENKLGYTKNNVSSIKAQWNEGGFKNHILNVIGVAGFAITLLGDFFVHTMLGGAINLAKGRERDPEAIARAKGRALLNKDLANNEKKFDALIKKELPKTAGFGSNGQPGADAAQAAKIRADFKDLIAADIALINKLPDLGANDQVRNTITKRIAQLQGMAGRLEIPQENGQFGLEPLANFVEREYRAQAYTTDFMAAVANVRNEVAHANDDDALISTIRPEVVPSQSLRAEATALQRSYPTVGQQRQNVIGVEGTIREQFTADELQQTLTALESRLPGTRQGDANFNQLLVLAGRNAHAQVQSLETRLGTEAVAAVGDQPAVAATGLYAQLADTQARRNRAQFDAAALNQAAQSMPQGITATPQQRVDFNAAADLANQKEAEVASMNAEMASLVQQIHEVREQITETRRSLDGMDHVIAQNILDRIALVETLLASRGVVAPRPLPLLPGAGVAIAAFDGASAQQAQVENVAEQVEQLPARPRVLGNRNTITGNNHVARRMIPLTRRPVQSAEARPAPVVVELSVSSSVESSVVSSSVVSSLEEQESGESVDLGAMVMAENERLDALNTEEVIIHSLVGEPSIEIVVGERLGADSEEIAVDGLVAGDSAAGEVLPERREVHSL